ncbi:MAG TPA: anti-sigma factor domain-containing protein [Negativicutes bacterium]|nr:anti-sigma factor domain-containing protein [Negativicutes bacterium]
MKAIVAEIDKKQMHVITDKGDFIKVKRQMSAGIGDVVEITAQKTFVPYRSLASIAACFLAVIFLSTGVYAYYTPYSYVSVDINPSMAMCLNRFERVLSVEPLTEETANFIENTKNLKNREIDEALSEILESASQKGYIDEAAENQIMLVVSSKNPKQEEELAGKVNAVAARELSKLNGNSEVTVAKTSVEKYKTALGNKVSPGREILENKLREIYPVIKDEELKDMTVKDVAKRIKEARKAEKVLEKENKAAERDQDNKEYLQSRSFKPKNKGTEAASANKDNGKGNGGKKAQPAATGSENKLKPAAVEKNSKDKNSSQNKSCTVDTDKNKNNGNINNNSADKDSDDEDDQISDDNDDSHKGNRNVKDKNNNKDNNKNKDKSSQDMEAK